MSNGGSSRVTISGQSNGGRRGWRASTGSWPRYTPTRTAVSSSSPMPRTPTWRSAWNLGCPREDPLGRAAASDARGISRAMRLITRSGLVDIMLMSASSSYALTFRETLFDNSPRHPAVRANDTTDVHLAAADRRRSPVAPVPHCQPRPRPVRAPRMWPPSRRHPRRNLGLYSVTFDDDLGPRHRDPRAVPRVSRMKPAEGFRYFLEVFDPNIPNAVAPDILPRYINDMISSNACRGCSRAGRSSSRWSTTAPRRWKNCSVMTRTWSSEFSAAGLGRRSTLSNCSRTLRSTRAKVAVRPQDQQRTENQLAFVQFLRLIVDGVINTIEAVKAYHAVLGRIGDPPASPARRGPQGPGHDDELRRNLHVRRRPRRQASACPCSSGCGCGYTCPQKRHHVPVPQP